MAKQHTIDWEFHFIPNTERREQWDDEKHKVTVTYDFIIDDWKKPNWLPGQEFLMYDEHIHNSFLCIVFEPDEYTEEDDDLAKEKMSEEVQEEYDKLLANILSGEHFSNEGDFKEEMARLHELHRGRFRYLLLPTVGERFTPVYIDKDGIWYNFDTFPLNEQPIQEKPSVYKMIDFWYKNDPKYNEVKTEYWLLGRDPRTVKTQGVHVTLKVCGRFLQIEIMVMYHAQYEICTEIIRSNIKSIHMKLLTDDRLHE